MDTDATSDNIRPFPGGGSEPPRHSRRRRKTTGRSADPTAALRSKRHRARRKQSVTTDAETVTAALDISPDISHGEIERQNKIPNEIKPNVTVATIEKQPFLYAPDMAAYAVAVGLAAAAAWFSIRGMVVLFPGSPRSVVAMAIAMESAKLVTAGWLARRWRATAAVWRAALMTFIVGLAVINAAGVYAQLVAAHVGERGAATSRLEERTADLEARTDVQTHKVADLDRRLGQIDGMIEEATKRGRTTAALCAGRSEEGSCGARGGAKPRGCYPGQP